MRILHTVEFYSPSEGGAQEVVRQLSERMVNMGHEVTIATTKLPERKQKTLNGVKIVEFDIHGNQVVGIKGETERYKRFLLDGRFDVMMNYAAQQWATDLVFEIIDEISAKKIIVPCGYSSLNNPDFKDYFVKLPSILKNMMLVFTLRSTTGTTHSPRSTDYVICTSYLMVRMKPNLQT